MGFSGSARGALAIVVFLAAAGPAAAQTQAASGVSPIGTPAAGIGSGGKYVDPATLEKRREIERAYRAATQKIPAQAAANDPWAGIRDADEGKPAKKKAAVENL